MSEREIFVAALAKSDPSARAAYLAEVCGADVALRQRVDSLVREHEQLGSFLESPAASPATATTEEAPRSEEPGSVIGAYKLLEQIGEGGFGVVFMAQQQEPIRRKVALKVLKPGMDTRQVIARFEAERQALALMDHPNIAKVLDAGQTPSGRPYFVMDLVSGLPITDFCDQQQLTPRQRLELFVHVCEAVQHAHHKGIIHRDLKPSNLLVTMQDGAPLVKVIDFGIAKALGQELTDKTLFTGFAQIIGTPLYMSPEQAAPHSVDVDTRSDIYSLGVVLYELLTGKTPFDKERLREAGLEEIRRIIREEEPPRPSTRVSTLGQAASTISNCRKSDPKRLSQLLRGELDWIVMKALDKDRKRRYESASAFAADVQRYLHDEPVQACPPSAWYRARKFIRRNKGVLTVAGLVLFFLAALGGGVGWVIRDREAHEEELARDRAAEQAKLLHGLELAVERAELFQAQGKRADTLAALHQVELLTGQVPADPARDARVAAVKDRLAAQDRDQEFMTRYEEIRLSVQSAYDAEQMGGFALKAADPEIRKALHRFGIEIGVTTPAQAAARIQQRPEAVQRSLLSALAECLWAAPKAEEKTGKWLLATLQAADNDAWRVRVRKAVVDGDWMVLEQHVREVDVRKQHPGLLILVAFSFPAPRESDRVELLERVQNAYPDDFWANEELGLELKRIGRSAEAIRYYTAALALRSGSPVVYVNRANALRDTGEVDAAIRDYLQALALAPRFAAAHNGLGLAWRAKGQLDKAIVSYHEALGIMDSAIVHNNLGMALRDKGLPDKAIERYRQAIRLDKNFAEPHENLAHILKAKGLVDEAIGEFRAAISLMKAYAQAHPDLGPTARRKRNEALAKALTNLANLVETQGHHDDSIRACREAIDLDPHCAGAYVNLGAALRARGNPDEAIAEYRKAIQILKNAQKDDPDLHSNLGAMLTERREVDEAIKELREAIRLKMDHAAAHHNLGFALTKKGFVQEAIEEFRAAIGIKEDYTEAHINLGVLLQQKGLIDDAIKEYRKAIQIKDDALAHSRLGNALLAKGLVEEAIDECRVALGLKNDDADAHYNLGNAWLAKGLADKAIVEYREAIQCKKDFAEAHYNLGLALKRKGQLDEAIAAYRAAIEFKNDYAEPHCNLGNVLLLKGQLDDAILEYRAAIQHKKDYAEAHFNLGNALLLQGEFDKALPELRRGQELGSRDPNWPRENSTRLIRECERLIALEGQLPGFLDGKNTPASAGERIELAEMCALKRMYRTTARFYEEAFAAKRELANDPAAGHRYNAACAAALAGCGQGKDAGKLDEKERAGLRRQALDWLRADLDAWQKILAREPGKARPAIIGVMQHWLADTDFAGVRGPQALAKLPEDERPGWQQTWDDVAGLLAQAQGKKPAPKKEATK
jgi:tetratricopeptide (TPR) repeat protein